MKHQNDIKVGECMCNSNSSNNNRRSNSSKSGSTCSSNNRETKVEVRGGYNITR